MPSQTHETLTTVDAQTERPAVAGAADAALSAERPAIIATRARCEADGVGLSHYILMDRKEPA